MSVLRDKRDISKTQFVADAYEIYKETISFLSKLSARFSRLMASPISEIAGTIADLAVQTQGIFLKDTISFQLREQYILEAIGLLDALDMRLSFAYQIMMQNPSGCFENTKTKQNVSSDKAIQKLDLMSDRLGDLIDSERKLLNGLLKSDKKQMDKIINQK